VGTVVEVKLNANVSVFVWQAEMYLESVFCTGGKLGAAPNYDRNSIERAAELGYNGHEPTWQMSRTHELLHHYLRGPRLSHWRTSMTPPEPPTPPMPTPPTAEEIERARAAVEELWPALLELVRYGYGELNSYIKDGRIEKWDALFIKRGRADK
jgi:hypothetical protein